MKKTKEQKKLEKEAKKELKLRNAAIKERNKAKKKEAKHSEFKPKSSSAWKNVIAVLLWIVILFFAARGIIGIVTMEDSDSVRKTLKETQQQLNTERAFELQTTAFAKNFVVDYFTYNEDNAQQWYNNIKNYIANGVTLTQPSGAETQKVVSAEISGFKVIDENNVDVKVSAVVQYETEKTEGEGEKTSVILQTPYVMEVPVRTRNGNMAVISTPLIKTDENNPAKVSGSGEELNESDVDEATKEKVKIALETFLKQYYGGSVTELKYIVTKNFDSHTTLKSLKYNGLTNVVIGKVANGYKSKVTIELQNGMTVVTQDCYITLVVEGGMLKIDSITTR